MGAFVALAVIGHATNIITMTSPDRAMKAMLETLVA